MEAALDVGAHIVNDVSALTFDDAAISVVARSACPVVLMHHQGNPQTLQDQPSYADPLIEVYDWLQRRLAAADAGGKARDDRQSDLQGKIVSVRVEPRYRRLFTKTINSTFTHYYFT